MGATIGIVTVLKGPHVYDLKWRKGRYILGVDK